MHVFPTSTHTPNMRSRVRNINSAINLRAEYWTLKRTSSISGKSGKAHTDTQSRSSHAHSSPLCLLSSHLPFHLYPCPLSSLPVSLPRSLTFTRLLWSIPLSSSPPASWMLKQEIKGWRSTLSGNQRCLGAFQPRAAGQAGAKQTRAGKEQLKTTQHDTERYRMTRVSSIYPRTQLEIKQNHYGPLTRGP